MIVVSDTSPLNYLAAIQRLDLLPTLFGRVMIPGAVAAEASHPAAPLDLRRAVVCPPPWLEIRTVHSFDPALERLGRGEAEAIRLAEEVSASFLLMDDLDARRLAAQRNTRTTGTLGVLLVAAQRGLVDLAHSIDLLRTTNFRITEDTVKEILRRASP